MNLILPKPSTQAESPVLRSPTASPNFIVPCLPSKVAGPPVHDIKHGGYRLMVRRDGSRVRCFTRNGHDWADRFGPPARSPHRPEMNDACPPEKPSVKRASVKKGAAHQAAPPVNNASTSKNREQAAAPVTRLSLLEILRERFGQNLFKFN